MSMPWTGVDTLSGVSQQTVLSGYDKPGVFDTRQLIPPTWEYGHLAMGAGMLNSHNGQAGHTHSSQTMFSPYDHRVGKDLNGRRMSSNQSFDNIFAEFEEKCSVGASRYMSTPTHEPARSGNKDHDERAAIERPRRRLDF